ncbi:hypothetical protein [Mesoplasma seiffertii]|uniref:hypothetical protein n=1 Tax=Mesoplasma seiffertii TaxID=28224 RepID=UPI00047A0935|nr:hypothetical protein [Mesoplasma seiffertii]
MATTEKIKFDKGAGAKWNQTFIFASKVISTFTNKNGKDQAVIAIGNNRWQQFLIISWTIWFKYNRRR